jgi:hypothetical protein
MFGCASDARSNRTTLAVLTKALEASTEPADALAEIG